MTKHPSSDTFSQLMDSVDGNDTFMLGHRIIRTRGRTKNAERVMPDWARNRSGVQKVLLRAFPKLATDPRQRARAARWARVIYFYFHMQESYLEIAEEMHETPNAVKMMIRGIKWVAEGRRANGTGFLGKPKGRPHKSVTP